MGPHRTDPSLPLPARTGTVSKVSALLIRCAIRASPNRKPPRVERPRQEPRTHSPSLGDAAAENARLLLGQVVAVNPATVRCPGLVVEQLVGVPDLLKRAGGDRPLVGFALLGL